MVQKLVIQVAENPLDDLLTRHSRISIILKSKAMVYERDVTIVLAGPVIKERPDAEQLRLELPEHLVIIEGLTDVLKIVKHHMHSARASVYTAVEIFHHGIFRCGDGLAQLLVGGSCRVILPEAGCIGDIVKESCVWRILSLHVRDGLVGRQHSGLGLLLTCREGSGRRTVQREPVQRTSRAKHCRAE